jgi:hypothetical protein
LSQVGVAVALSSVAAVALAVTAILYLEKRLVVGGPPNHLLLLLLEHTP